MGNFLFQAACAIGYAHRHNLPYTLPTVSTNPKHNPIYLQHLAKRSFNPHLESITLEEKQFTYNELPFDEKWRGKNIYLDGYWQTEKYFIELRDQILAAFNFRWQHWQGFVSVHVRRTDYLKLIHKHPPVPVEWIEEAMRLFPGYHFIFYSDDLPWCKATFGHRKDVSFSGGTEVDDLIHMSWCEHHICSASTFSWWGAWLNRYDYKRIVMPKLWFQPGHGGLDTSDIVPASWERL